MNGVQAALEILAASGVRHLFGNPGTTELPLNAAVLGDTRFRYYLGLHEIPVVAMADGLALASRQLTVVNLHGSCGLGNALGMLYNASIEGTPLLVLIGDQDRRLIVEEPVLSGDPLAMARPVMKFAAQVTRIEDLPRLLRRAIQIALTPPTGPVVLSLPLDLQQELVQDRQLDLSAASCWSNASRPAEDSVQRAAQHLVAARNPVILAGSRVTEALGIDALVRCAEQLGAPVFSESTPSHGRLPFPPDHPLYAGPLPSWCPDVAACLAEFDVVLAVGLNVFRLYLWDEPARLLGPTTTLIQLDNCPHEIAKNYAVAVGMICDPAAGLRDLGEAIERIAPAELAEHASRRRQRSAERRAVEQKRLRGECEAEQAARPMTSRTLMEALGRVLPAQVAIVEEAITTHHNWWERMGYLRDPVGFFAHRGWALGWGIGCAMGVQLAWPDRPTLALLGDGASMYGIQGLWTAARYEIPVTFVIANNRQYKILKVCGDMLEMPALHDPRCEGVDLGRPAIDFVGLAKSLGIEAMRLTEPEELSARVWSGWHQRRPLLIEVPVSP